jgi:hypothetical protein
MPGGQDPGFTVTLRRSRNQTGWSAKLATQVLTRVNQTQAERQPTAPRP